MKTVLKILAVIGGMNLAFCDTIHVPEDYPTIQEALYSASSGDSILVAPGTYSNFVWSGVYLQDITVLGSGAFGDSVTRLYGDVTTDGVRLEDVIGWEIAGFEITNFTTGICAHHSIDLHFHDNYIHHNPYSHASGFYLVFCNGVSAHHNVLAYNNYVGVRIHNGNENISVINNTVLYTNSFHGFLIMDYTPGLEIINNIIAFNDNDGIQFQPGISQGDAIITYNDNYGNGNNWNNCTPGIGNISEDPLFTNLQPFLYDLQSGSPCIDAGDPHGPLDPDGTRADIGALYYDQRPPPIEDLTISVILTNVNLDWRDVPHATIYYIYRSPQPYFSLTGTAPYDSSASSDYIDSGALNEGPGFYRVTYED